MNIYAVGALLLNLVFKCDGTQSVVVVSTNLSNMNPGDACLTKLTKEEVKSPWKRLGGHFVHPTHISKGLSKQMYSTKFNQSENVRFDHGSVLYGYLHHIYL